MIGVILLIKGTQVICKRREAILWKMGKHPLRIGSE